MRAATSCAVISGASYEMACAGSRHHPPRIANGTRASTKYSMPACSSVPSGDLYPDSRSTPPLSSVPYSMTDKKLSVRCEYFTRTASTLSVTCDSGRYDTPAPYDDGAWKRVMPTVLIAEVMFGAAATG